MEPMIFIGVFQIKLKNGIYQFELGQKYIYYYLDYLCNEFCLNKALFKEYYSN
jgi:hypothetical protein